MRKAHTSAICSAPATYSCGRWPKTRAMRWARSKTSRMIPKVTRKGMVKSQSRRGFMGGVRSSLAVTARLVLLFLLRQPGDPDNLFAFGEVDEPYSLCVAADDGDAFH